MATKIILIRHGQTAWSAERRYFGLTDIGLNTEGKKQARKLYRILNKEGIYKVYSSDSRRAFDFAKVAFKDSRVEKIPELREINFGVFEGLTYRQIMKRYSKIYKKWLKDPFNVIIPNGESLKTVRRRVEKALSKILSSNKNKVIAIVTHAGPIKIIIGSILKSNDIWSIESDLCGISIIEFKNGKGSIKSVNDTSYLNG